ncbi:MAG TPA: glycosyltransferase family 2 protein [Candidatus Binatia bacterium]|nr:glycosyltransferase family 2 protein [Candidatus Binatia bacterium]
MTRSDKPLVSICIPTYNRANVVGTAIRSALDQTYPNVQVIVSDNCSTDGTVELLERFRREAPDRFRFVVNDSNLGMHANYSRCTELAEGKYFKIICSDDRAYSTMVERQVEALETHPTAAVATARRRRLSDSLLFRLYDPLLKMRAGLWNGREAVRYTFRLTNMIGGSAQLLMRVDAFRLVGRIRNDPVVGNMFDVEPFLRLFASGWDLYVNDEILCDYNSYTSSYTRATLSDPAVQDYFFAFREEQARDPLYAQCLRLPDDLRVSKRNAALLLMIAGFAATFPQRDRQQAKILFDYLVRKGESRWPRVLRAVLSLMLRMPGGVATAPPLAA